MDYTFTADLDKVAAVIRTLAVLRPFQLIVSLKAFGRQDTTLFTQRSRVEASKRKTNSVPLNIFDEFSPQGVDTV